MELDKLKNEITESINNSKLPIDAIYYVIKDLFNEVVYLYNQQIQKEQNQKEEGEKKEERNEE